MSRLNAFQQFLEEHEQFIRGFAGCFLPIIIPCAIATYNRRSAIFKPQVFLPSAACPNRTVPNAWLNQCHISGSSLTTSFLASLFLNHWATWLVLLKRERKAGTVLSFCWVYPFDCFVAVNNVFFCCVVIVGYGYSVLFLCHFSHFLLKKALL